MKIINDNRREELEAALTTLTGDNGRIYPACELSNPESSGFASVIKALRVVNGEGFVNYLDTYEWDDMDEEGRAEYADNYEEFCDACDSFNSSIISKAIDDIKKELGTLLVKPRDIYVVTEGKTAVYTGSPIENRSYTVEGTLVEGHTIYVSVTGKQTDVGVSNNTFIAEIKDKNGNIVTSNYNVASSLGLLEVLPVDITITSSSAPTASARIGLIFSPLILIFLFPRATYSPFSFASKTLLPEGLLLIYSSMSNTKTCHSPSAIRAF